MIGTKLDKYILIEKIGRGGYGEVYRCKDSETDDEYALKYCTKTEGDDLNRFAREVRLMQSISHPNIINIEFSNTETIPYYFVMPLAKASLEKYISKLKDNHEFALTIFLEICIGVKALHTSGKFHRDIKPENVLILPDDRILVSDLGLGKFENRDSTIITRSNMYMGTDGYIPPEFKIARGTKNADKRGDVYQLGKLLYKILTGENPILIIPTSLPSSLMYIISKATKDNPDERFQNVSELMDAVNNYIASIKVDSNPIKAYESYIKTAKELLKKGECDDFVIREILKILYSSKADEVQFFQLFDKIPLALIPKIVSDYTVEFNQVFDEYTTKIYNYISVNNLGFAYVEIVAKLMRVVFNTSKDINVKKDALKNNLVSSVYYGRYFAMDIFDELLLSIKDETEARTIAPMLLDEKKWFKERIEALQYNDLHSEFQSIIDFIKKEHKTEKQPFSFDEL